jgi:hypothetical protein
LTRPPAPDRALRLSHGLYPLPAQGTTTGSGTTVHDEIVVFEVMTNTLDASWWGSYRLHLEREFRQDEIVVRASSITLL